MRRLLYIVVIVALVIVGVMFGSINQQVAELNLLLVSVSLRVVDIALIFMLSGIVIGLAIAMLYSLQRKTKSWLSKSPDNA